MRDLKAIDYETTDLVSPWIMQLYQNLVVKKMK